MRLLNSTFLQIVSKLAYDNKKKQSHKSPYYDHFFLSSAYMSNVTRVSYKQNTAHLCVTP